MSDSCTQVGTIIKELQSILYFLFEKFFFQLIFRISLFHQSQLSTEDIDKTFIQSFKLQEDINDISSL